MTSGTEVSHLLYNKSGLFGVSGISDDMRTLLASDDPSAKEAVALFVYRIGRELGSMAAALGGIDALVFTAGIGEHAAEIRRRVCGAASSRREYGSKRKCSRRSNDHARRQPHLRLDDSDRRKPDDCPSCLGAVKSIGRTSRSALNNGSQKADDPVQRSIALERPGILADGDGGNLA